MGATPELRRDLAIPEGIAIGMLLWALLPVNPYGYYVLLRFAICGISAYLAYRAHRFGKVGWMWLFVLSAITYNPVIRIHLTREIWSGVNVATIVLFALAILALKPKTKSKDVMPVETQGH